MIKILVVEDDIDLNKAVTTYLNDIGYDALGCYNVNDAYNEMYDNQYDLVISDIMMPDIDGFEFAKTLRGLDKNIPIIFMSAKDDLISKQKGFIIGIDDYIVKPIVFEELNLRIKALLRRSNINTEKKIVVGGLTMDAEEMNVSIDGEEINVTVREFNILFKLLSYPKKIFSRAQLMNEFWDVDSDTSLRAVDVYITKIRDKFSSCDDFKITTVHGLGYKAILNDKEEEK